MMRSPRNQRGVALIMVLLAAALATSLAAGMMSRQSLMIERASHHLGQQQARSLALGAEVFARQVLYRDWEEDRKENSFVDHPLEAWARYAATLPVETGVVEVQVNDLQGRLNLNDLVSAQGAINAVVRDRFARLLEVLEIRSLRVEQLIDWIDPNEQPVGAYGGEDGNYLSLSPAYRAANRPFVDTSELRLMESITTEDYRKLLPHVAALPLSGQGLNVNMATIPVLQSLHPDVTQSQAEAILAAREEAAFGNVQDFLARPEFAGLGLKADGLTVQTQFFEVAAQVSVAGRTYRLVSSLYRSNDGKLSVISRDAGEHTIITKNRVTADE
jgi:general secretion pathway protein K